MVVGKVKTKVLIAGCGDLGLAVAARLDPSTFDLYGLRRSPQSFAAGHISAIQADVTRPDSLAAVRGLDPEILLYCVSADAQTDESYKAHYVDGLRNVLAALEHHHLQHVFFVSSTRVYGQKGDALIDESIKAVPADFGGERLLEGERLLDTLDCATTALRLSGIYGPGRTRMLRLAREPRHWPSENLWTNRIHRDDAADFVAFLFGNVSAGLPVEACYIVTDNQPVAQHEVLNWLAGQLKVDVRGLPMPPVAGGKRLDNHRLRATGFLLAYPDYRAGYTQLINMQGDSQN
jgi:nucleoside-diphosphate-sugar epimerase